MAPSAMGRSASNACGPALALMRLPDIATTVGCVHDVGVLPAASRRHRALVSSWFARHGEDLQAHVAAQGVALQQLGFEIQVRGHTVVVGGWRGGMHGSLPSRRCEHPSRDLLCAGHGRTQPQRAR
eukprot:7105196-Prymnesium_polylepis.2